MKILGLCIGASTISAVQLERNTEDQKNRVSCRKAWDTIRYSIHPHEGGPRQTLLSALEAFDLKSFDRIAATGRKFKSCINLSSISEPEAVEYAYRYAKPSGISCPAVVAAGGETFMVYVLNRSGQISNVLTGNKCASGTGEFFLQQIRRLNVSLEEAARWSAEQSPYPLSSRCSVFCKSDCTHATNKGIAKARVTAGLCKMMAGKILELLKKVPRRNIMICGGTSQNHMMIDYLRKEIPGLIVPEEAPYFEALGAALWALEHETTPFPGTARLFHTQSASFECLPPLSNFHQQVEFRDLPMGRIHSGDICLLGLDVGSTTTKAVLIRKSDQAILASVYLRTNGDPVEASRQCYSAVLRQISSHVAPREIVIEGLGICGSGRQISGLHALTDAVINEIIAHATAAVYFDPEVDTIFEIGGQDAKYTYIINRVPADYAMNEACSAGTGSFLEESAYETLGVKMEDIADIAIAGTHPPNFNDQCAAFIASDIKNAIHEGVRHEDIIAGLVYSICMNYSNRVKGNRPVGEKVFMQGGVCYNRAVPLAMASLIGKRIIVPPHPGLMGAFGVALEVKSRIEAGLMQQKRFDLEVLARRQVGYGKSFVCRGGSEKCDRHCEIALIEIEGKAYPFGGACNRYYNLRHQINYDVNALNQVRFRQHLVYETYGSTGPNKKSPPGYRGRVGFNKSFMVHTYYPLYSTFFSELGYEPVLPEAASAEGIEQRQAAFCYPAELSHGFFYNLIHMPHPPDAIFLPHFKSIPTLDSKLNSCVCPIVQGEAYFLQTAFRKKLNDLKQKEVQLLFPVIDLKSGLHAARKPLVNMALRMGIPRPEANRAFTTAAERQDQCLEKMQQAGRRILDELEAHPEQIAIVILARPYNGFTDDANMGIPHKLASRGIRVLPMDFLPLEAKEAKRHMYWGMGQRLLNAAGFIKRHPQLFATYITNFSCGPDSFIIGYVRELMGRKPCLTLELDNHTADAGLETRIEAFLDIVNAFGHLRSDQQQPRRPSSFTPAQMVLHNGTAMVKTSSGSRLSLTDPQVTIMLPSMGKIATESLAAVFRGKGLRTFVHPPATEPILKLGRAHTSCKECLPLILTTGMLLNYIYNHKQSDEVVVYFMPTGSGPCRFGQYYIFMEDLIRRLNIPDVALLALSSDNAYAGFNNAFQIRGWWAVIVSDVMEDIRSMLLANAADPDAAMKLFNAAWALILTQLENGKYRQLEDSLRKAVACFRHIPMKIPPENVPVISISGEIFVRRDSLSRQYLTEKMAQKGFATTCSPVAEWLHYSDYLVTGGLTDDYVSVPDTLSVHLRQYVKKRYEKKIKSILSDSGLVHAHPIDLPSIMRHAEPYLSRQLAGEAILTVGSALSEIVSQVCGVIAIGPFGCMPNRLAESILTENMSGEIKLASDPDNRDLQSTIGDLDELPFLAIESDGSPFPQLITAKLETFCLRARRLNEKILGTRPSIRSK